MPRQITAVAAAAVGALLVGLLWWRRREPDPPDRFGEWKPVE